MRAKYLLKPPGTVSLGPREKIFGQTVLLYMIEFSFFGFLTVHYLKLDMLSQ
jgi:hypothetical protein